MKLKQNRGITLIALIITIIILLILAIVTIAAVNGDGIITKAKQAKTDYENAQATENSLLGNYLAEMENLVGNNTSTEGSLSREVFDSITAANYGDTITYSAGGVEDWKIFYKDESNLYIIASKDLNSSFVPNSLKMSTVSDTCCAYWSDDNSFVSTGTFTITEEIANKYMLSWRHYVGSSISRKEAKAVGDLLDTRSWSVFAGGIEGAEAVGAPTLEMWIASWNSKGDLLGTDKYQVIDYEFNSYLGYDIITNGTQSTHNITLDNSTDGINDELYFYARENAGSSWQCYKHWIASPSENGRLWTVGSNGYLSYSDTGASGWRDGPNWYNAAPAVRPVVSIPYNAIGLNDDGNFKVMQ